ncbi:MAG: GIDE domain-containing protein [Bdellovibrionota bacterium]
MANQKAELLKLGIFLSVMAAGLLRSGFKRMAQTRKVLDAGSVPIASAPQGFVEIQGHAWPGNPLYSYIEGKPSVYVSLLVQEKVRSGKRSHWKTIFRDDSVEPFFLADETGHAVIYPDKARFEVSSTEMSWGQLNSLQRERVQEAVRKMDPNFRSGDENWIFKKTLRVKEQVIAAGAPLYALGHFQTMNSNTLPRPAVGLGLFFSHLAKLRKNPNALRSAFDFNRDGTVSFEEWYRGYASVAEATTGGFAGNTPLVLPAGMQNTNSCFGVLAHTNLHELYLADCHQDELVRRIGSYNLLRLVGGALLCAIAAILIYAQFNPALLSNFNM